MVARYRELIAWQKAFAFADAVYNATDSFPVREQYGLSSQLRRSALSVPSNIAEGNGRLSSGEWSQFLGQARGSLYEAQTQLLLAARRGYGNEEELRVLLADSEELGRIINGLRTSAATKFEAKKFEDVIKDAGVDDEEYARASWPPE